MSLWAFVLARKKGELVNSASARVIVLGGVQREFRSHRLPAGAVEGEHFNAGFAFDHPVRLLLGDDLFGARVDVFDSRRNHEQGTARMDRLILRSGHREPIPTARVRALTGEIRDELNGAASGLSPFREPDVQQLVRGDAVEPASVNVHASPWERCIGSEPPALFVPAVVDHEA